MNSPLPNPDRPGAAEEGRWIYLLPRSAAGSQRSVYVSDILKALALGWYWIVLAAFMTAAAGAAYALTATQWYRVEVLLAPADRQSVPAGLGQLGGLADLAGISLSTNESAELLALLQSRELASEFIEHHELTTVLLADKWDEADKRWREPDPAKQPDMRDAVEFFRNKVLTVYEQRKDSGLVTLIIDWKSPDQASEWATQFVNELNERARTRVLRDSQRSVDLLRKELQETNLVPMQQSIARVLESELQKLTLARSAEEFAYKIVDRAVPPRKPFKPRKVLVVVLSLVLGAFLGTVAVLICTRRKWLFASLRSERGVGAEGRLGDA